MFTLITGSPGTGKSSSAMEELLALVPKQPSKLKEKILTILGGVAAPAAAPRTLYVHGIPDLQIPHTLFYCSSQSCAFCQKNRPTEGDYLAVENWRTWCAPGSFVVFDESQHCFRPQPAGSVVPDHVTFFEIHRHNGIDGLLITQHPKLLHSNVRRLVGKHVHIVRTFAGSFKYEWPETSDTLSYAQAVKVPFKKNPKTYALYKSAEIHNKFKLRIHPAVYVMAVSIPVVGYFAWKSYGVVSQDNTPMSITDVQVIPGESISDDSVPGELQNVDTDGGVTLASARGAPPAARSFYQEISPGHPLEDFDLILIGVSVVGSKLSASFVAQVEGFEDFYFTASHLREAGYILEQMGRCAVRIHYQEFSRSYSCLPVPKQVQEQEEQRQGA